MIWFHWFFLILSGYVAVVTWVNAKENKRLRDWRGRTDAERGLWICPECGCAFGKEHTDADGGYSCPVCEEARLAVENERLRKALEPFCWVYPDASIEELVEAAKSVRTVLGIDPPGYEEEESA